jgi:hypothetical protein
VCVKNTVETVVTVDLLAFEPIFVIL